MSILIFILITVYKSVQYCQYKVHDRHDANLFTSASVDNIVVFKDSKENYQYQSDMAREAKKAKSNLQKRVQENMHSPLSHVML